MRLLFDQTKLPRTFTRKQWKEIDRWRRVTEERLAEQVAEQISNLAIYGNTHPHLKARMMDEIINPSLLIGPYQGFGQKC